MPFLLCVVIGVLLAPFVSLKPVLAVAGGVFLLLSGWEFNTRELIKEFRLSLGLWAGAFFLPFVTGVGLVALWPWLFAPPPGVSQTTTAVILGIAMAVSAVPVVLKIMQELGWAGTVRARRVILTAILCDLTAWLCFLPLLPTSGQGRWMSSHLTLLMFFVGLISAFIWPTLTKPRRSLKFLNEWVVAPIFFIGIGQSLNFSQGFHLMQVLVVFFAATISKTSGVWLAAKKANLEADDCKSIAVALNARGAMEVVMAGSALSAGLISNEMFLSLIVMAFATSLIIKPIFYFSGRYF